MSRLGSAILWPATARSDETGRSPPRMIEMSVEVPPMSNGIRLPARRSRAARCAAGDAAGRPGQQRRAGKPHRLGDRRHAAMRQHDVERAGEAFGLRRASSDCR